MAVARKTGCDVPCGSLRMRGLRLIVAHFDHVNAAFRATQQPYGSEACNAACRCTARHFCVPGHC